MGALVRTTCGICGFTCSARSWTALYRLWASHFLHAHARSQEERCLLARR